MLFNDTVGKKLDTIFGADGKKAFHTLDDEWKKVVGEKFPTIAGVKHEHAEIATDYLEGKLDDLIHVAALKDEKRADGRAFDQVRAIYAKAGGFSPVLHGTGIFYRGETHVLSSAHPRRA